MSFWPGKKDWFYWHLTWQLAANFYNQPQASADENEYFLLFSKLIREYDFLLFFSLSLKKVCFLFKVSIKPSVFISSSAPNQFSASTCIHGGFFYNEKSDEQQCDQFRKRGRWITAGFVTSVLTVAGIQGIVRNHQQTKFTAGFITWTNTSQWILQVIITKRQIDGASVAFQEGLVYI